MLNHKTLRFLLPAILSIMLAMGGFNCNILGPHITSSPDTTSNNFSFQSWSFGASNAGGSTLQDVAIISDSDIWAVGAIYLDSADGNPDPNAYNGLHWNGQKWTNMRIPVPLCGSSSTQPFPLYSVFAFASDDVWFTGGGDMEHWDGVTFTTDCSMNALISGRVNKIGGTSSTDIYIVGNAGTIVHYSDGSWQKVQSGTTLNFDDIYGSGGQIIAVASDPADNYNRKIVQLNGTTATDVSDFPIPWPLSTVWFVPNKVYYVAGSGVWEKNRLSDSTWKDISNVSQYYSTVVRGNSVNDVFIAGAYGEFLHWNGVRWYSFLPETSLNSGAYGSMAVKGNLVVAVGQNEGKGVVLMGTRQ